MPSQQISQNGTWIRRIHCSWGNASGYRTDVRASLLADPKVKRAAFVLDDGRAIIVSIEDMRRALANAPRRPNGCVGPYNVDPQHSTLNGVMIPMEIRVITVKNRAA
ncbi:MAG: hypothetical protein KA257_05845 [Opitutaceae bacterium]|nr:hypothetical protein [Opitutaceae bacterium]